MECNLGWNLTCDFKIERVHSASSIWNHKYDLRPSILKSPKYRTWSIFYWCSTELVWNKIRPFLAGKKQEFWKQGLQNLPYDTLCLSFSCNYIGYFKQAVKKKVPDWRVVQLARALRHLTLISRKQVTLTISRVCVVVVLVAVLSRRFSRSFSGI